MATVDFTRINTNIAALNSLNTLREVNKNLAIAQTRLATGRRINEAADDPAGFAQACARLKAAGVTGVILTST